MKNQQPASAQSQRILPRQKLPKYILILFLLFFVIASAEAFYYFYLRGNINLQAFNLSIGKKKEGAGITENDLSEKLESEPKRYFEGLRYYEETDGEKQLLIIEGTIDKIDLESKTVVLKGKEATEEIKYADADIIYLTDFDTRDQKEGSFSDLEGGDFVAYDSTNPGIEAGQGRAIWNVQKQ